MQESAVMSFYQLGWVLLSRFPPLLPPALFYPGKYYTVRKRSKKQSQHQGQQIEHRINNSNHF